MGWCVGASDDAAPGWFVGIVEVDQSTIAAVEGRCRCLALQLDFKDSVLDTLGSESAEPSDVVII